MAKGRVVFASGLFLNYLDALRFGPGMAAFTVRRMVMLVIVVASSSVPMVIAAKHLLFFLTMALIVIMRVMPGPAKYMVVTGVARLAVMMMRMTIAAVRMRMSAMMAMAVHAAA